MGSSEVKATLCPNCSYEHVIVPMFKTKKQEYFCLLCRKAYQKRVNGKTVFIPIEKDKILEIMRNAVKLEVPVKLDVEEGPSWGQAK